MRVCSRIGCGHSIDHKRSNAVYCTAACAREASRQRNGFSRPEGPPQCDWSRYAQVGGTARRTARSRFASHRKAAA